MATVQPPPAYSGDQAPPSYPILQPVQGDQAPPAYPILQPVQQRTGGQNQKKYWIYWGALFATSLTWVFAVAATVNAEWLANVEEDATYTYAGFEEYYCSDTHKAFMISVYGATPSMIDDLCSTWEAGKAMQYTAAILVSVVLVLVMVAALLAAPMTGKLGLAAGITLAVFSVCELIAFSLMATLVKKEEDIRNIDADSDDVLIEMSPGTTMGWAVTAFILGVAGAVTALILRARATDDQDGPFRKCMSGAKTYWIYWGVLFATPLTWVFTVVATVGDEWMAVDTGEIKFTTAGFNKWFCIADWHIYQLEDLSNIHDKDVHDEICSAVDTAKAMQYVAIALASVVLVLVVVAALLTAPNTRRLGLAAGITLVVFSVCQATAFSLMASVASKYEKYLNYDDDDYYNDDDYTTWEVGPSFIWAVFACIVGLVGAIAALVLQACGATTDQDGPFRKCMFTTTASPSAAHAVGKV